MVKRVLHIVGSMNRAGAETMIMNIYRAIDKTVVQFDFVYFTDKPSDYDEEITLLGGRIFRLSPLKYKNSFARCIGIYSIIKKNKYNIVHSHVLLNSCFHVLTAWLSGAKVRVTHAHSTSNEGSNKLVRTIYYHTAKMLINMFSNRFVACGKAAAAFLFYKNKNVYIINNPVDVSKFQLVNPVEKNKESDLILLQVGRLESVKNHLYSINIAQELNKRGINFKLFVVGCGSLEYRLKDYVKKIGLDNKVLFLGTRNDIPDLMAKSDYLLMPSIYEGFPVTLVESQAAGLPALISDNIPHEVDLELGLIKFLSIQADSIELWLKELTSKSLRCKFSKSEIKEVIVSKGFDVHQVVNDMYEIYI